MRYAGLVSSILILLGLALPASADPCIDCDGDGQFEYQWSYDRLLAGQPAGPVGQPDVAWPDFSRDRIYLVWSQDAGTGSGFDVYLATTDDGGCNWRVSPIAAGPEDEIEPAIAADAAGNCFVVVFNRVSDEVSGRGTIFALNSVDGGVSFLPEAQLSSDTEMASRLPDIATTPGQSATHFHATWQAAVGGGIITEHVFYARNLSMCGADPLPWVGAGDPPSLTETDLTTDLSHVCGFSIPDSFSPHIAADTRSIRPFQESATSIVFQTACGGERHVLFTRSSDSGDHFFGREPDPQVIPPLKIDALPGAAVAEADIDASDTGSGVGFGQWNAVLWPGGRGGSGHVEMDAQQVDGGAISSDWNDPDVEASTLFDPSATGVALSAWDRPAVILTETVFASYWTDWDPDIGSRDIWYRAGRASPGEVPNLSFTCESELPTQLTGVSPDPRMVHPGTAASLPAADERAEMGIENHLAIAWVDTRNTAEGEIFFKRTDLDPPGPAQIMEVEPGVCPDNDIFLSWLPPSDCDVKLYRLTVIGATTEELEVYPPDTSVTIPIADPGVYQIRLRVEDEACNLSTEVDSVDVQTPLCPDLAEAPLELDVECNGQPDNDNDPDPGETVFLTLPIRNEGTAAATGVTGSLSVLSPAGVTVATGVSSYPDIAVGGTELNDTLYRLELSTSAPCEEVDLELAVTSDQEPSTLLYMFQIGLVNCEPDACEEPVCDVGAILAIEEIKAAKLSADDLELSWQPDAEAADGYNAWFVGENKELLPACEGCAGSMEVDPIHCLPTGDASATTCTHTGGIAGDPGDIFFYNVRGVCLGEEAAQ